MTPEEKHAFVRTNHRAVLITYRRDGRLQTSPIVCGAHGDGRVAISVTEDRAKTKNLRRDPRATLCVFTNDYFGPWVQIDGSAELIAMPEALDGLKALYRQVSGADHPDWSDFERAMTEDRRLLLAHRHAIDPPAVEVGAVGGVHGASAGVDVAVLKVLGGGVPRPLGSGMVRSCATLSFRARPRPAPKYVVAAHADAAGSAQHAHRRATDRSGRGGRR